MHAAIIAAHELHAPMDAALTYLVILQGLGHLAVNLYITLFHSCDSSSVSLPKLHVVCSAVCRHFCHELIKCGNQWKVPRGQFPSFLAMEHVGCGISP